MKSWSRDTIVVVSPPGTEIKFVSEPDDQTLPTPFGAKKRNTSPPALSSNPFGVLWFQGEVHCRRVALRPLVAEATYKTLEISRMYGMRDLNWRRGFHCRRQQVRPKVTCVLAPNCEVPYSNCTFTLVLVSIYQPQ